MKDIKIPKSLFEPLPGRGEDESDFSLGRYGYFRDAWRRFIRLTSAKMALGALVIISLFSLLVPLFTARSETLMDPYYAKLPPRVSLFGGRITPASGAVERRLGDEGLARLYGIGIGSGSERYNPALSVGDAVGRVREVRLDSYLEVGFVYKSISKEKYRDIIEWEKESGLQVLYPLIADNEYSGEAADANVWYKVGSDGLPISVSDSGVTPIPVSENMQFSDNYLYDSEGNAVYAAPYGGGSTEARALRVRVLYYNWYIYENGMEPNYLFGTDSQGYDLALRVAGGIRVSLLLAFAISLINLVIGALVGAVEGYYGGTLDLVIERVIDVLSGVPFIVVATLFQIYLSDKVGAIPSLLFAFVLTGWIRTANRVRGQFFRFKSSEYVLAAKTMGVGDARIIWRHIFPNTLGTLITSSALAIPGVIFTESMLSFLGIVNLGAEGVTSLGTLLSDAAGIWVGYPHLMIAPAAVISILMISFNIMGNGLRDAFNPATKGGV